MVKENAQPAYKPIYKDKDGDWFIELWFIPIMVGFVPGVILLAISTFMA